MCEARDENNKISVKVIVNAKGFTEEQLQELWIGFFNNFIDKLVEIKNGQD